MIADLSPREVQVLDLPAQGLVTATIAERLDLSPKTVRNRLSIVFAKLGVADRVAAVVLARDAGLGRPGGRWQTWPPSCRQDRHRALTPTQLFPRSDGTTDPWADSSPDDASGTRSGP